MSTLGLFAALSSVGWLLLLIGFAVRRHRLHRQEQERTRATGTVVAHADSPGSKGAFCAPVIEFMAEGQKVRRPCKGAFERESYPVGQTLDILYDADDPTRFHPDVDAQFAPGRGVMLAGLAWIALAVILTVAMSGPLERRRSEDEWTSPLSGMPRVSTVNGNPMGDNGDFRYTLKEDGTAILNSYTGDEANLSLPLLINGHIVTGMAQSAFASNRSLSRVQVPGTVRAISNGAFAGCLALREVALSDGIQSIGHMAFLMCPSLKDVAIPSSVTSIADDAFPEGCAATFHIAAGSAAERYCGEKGFTVETSG